MVRIACEGEQFEHGAEFLCQSCENKSKLPAYVSAHWREGIVYTCTTCGTRTEFCEGVVESVCPSPANSVQKRV